MLPPKGFQNLLNQGMNDFNAYHKSPNVLGITKELQKELKETLIHLKKQMKLYKLLLEFRISRLPKYFQPYAKLHFQKAFRNELPESVRNNEKHTENRITLFEKNVRQAVESNNHKQHPYTNLTSVQREVLKQLKQSKDLVILPTDKNLGPAILNRDQYITQVLSEHLLTPAYLQLSKETAINKLENTKQLFLESYQTHKHLLSQAETEYFSRSFKNSNRMPTFYGMPKVHRTPLKL
jgi:hypothetical protein